MDRKEMLKKLDPVVDTQRVNELLNNLEQKDDLKKVEDSLNELQNICNKIYYNYGLNEGLLELQVQINTTRNKYNIPDKTGKTNSEGYVQ